MKPEDIPGIKQSEIKKCVSCGQGVAHPSGNQPGGGPNLTFYRVTLEHCMLDPQAIQRHAGFEQMMGGGNAGAAIANIMGPNHDMAKIISTHKHLWVCYDCAVNVCLASIGEAAANDDAANDDARD